MQSLNQLTFLCWILCFSIVSFAQDSEKKISQSDLPAAVQQTVQAEAKGATIRGFSKEIEKGHTYYEAKLRVNGHSKDVLMDSNGKVVEVEEEVATNSLPQSVQQGLKTKAGAGTISKVESLTKNGKLVAYEAKVRNGSKKSEIQVGPDGKPLDHEE